jgi:hypothetical protein
MYLHLLIILLLYKRNDSLMVYVFIAEELLKKLTEFYETCDEHHAT